MCSTWWTLPTQWEPMSPLQSSSCASWHSTPSKVGVQSSICCCDGAQHDACMLLLQQPAQVCMLQARAMLQSGAQRDWIQRHRISDILTLCNSPSSQNSAQLCPCSHQGYHNPNTSSTLEFALSPWSALPARHSMSNQMLHKANSLLLTPMATLSSAGDKLLYSALTHSAGADLQAAPKLLPVG